MDYLRNLLGSAKTSTSNTVEQQDQNFDAPLQQSPAQPASAHPTVQPVQHQNQAIMAVPQSMPVNEIQQINEAGGYSFAVCDMMRLKRFLVIGTESGTYYTKGRDIGLQQIECVSRLIEKGHGDKVLQVLEDFSIKGRVSKEEPILMALTICATCPKLEVQKAAYAKVAAICNIPTKLFTFLSFCQAKINSDRQKNPPTPQPTRKRPHITTGVQSMSIKKEPTENEDADPTPVKKKKKLKKPKGALKKVNTQAKKSSGWGRMRRTGISSFYTDKNKGPDRLLYLLSKYKQRVNWSHQQVLRYAHPEVKEEDMDINRAKNLVLTYSARGYEAFKKRTQCYRDEDGKLQENGVPQVISQIVHYIETLNEVSKLNPQNEGDEGKLLECMQMYGVRTYREDFSVMEFGMQEPPENEKGRRCAFQIVREHIPTGFLKSVPVWEALLQDMPMTALIRNLGKMSSIGLFGTEGPDTNNNVKIVRDALRNVDRLKIARVHPIKILIALRVYQQEKGIKGDLAWQKNPYICDYLDEAFYLSFTNPEVKGEIKTNKKYMLCLDVSGSMTWQGCYGCEQLTPATASVAMAMVTLNVEDHCDIMAFGGHFESLENRLNKTMKLEEAIKATSGLNFGATDCSLPMIYAKEHDKDVDVFIVYTDSDTWAGKIHPHQALREYNAFKRKQAKLIVCAMQSNGFTIADPNDFNMLDICGFDTSVPEIISTFARGISSERCNVCAECRQ